MDTLIDRIEENMQEDDADREDQSARLIALYQKATADQKQQLDDAFICVCGFSLKTLIAQRA